MSPVLLFRETFDGEVGTINLEDRTPVPGPGGAAEYAVNPNRFKVYAAGYGQSASDFGDSIPRYPDAVPPGIRLRVIVEVFREGSDKVGGGTDVYAYCPSPPSAPWDFTDCIRGAVQRMSFGGVSLAIVWKKAVGAPSPPTLQLVFAGDIEQLAGTTKRYEFEFDETVLDEDGAGRVRIYRSDSGSGLNPVFVGEGILPPELIGHLTADRLFGWTSSYDTIGLTGFRLGDLQVWDMGALPTPATGAPCTLLLRVYDDDRVTVLWEVASDPAHAFPYLQEPDDYGEQELDFAAGSASLGSVRVRVVDKAQIAGDQDSGFATGKLAALGIPAIGGRRCELIRFDPDGNPVVIMDGPAGQPVMAGYSAFDWEIRDTRETERKVRCFDVVGSSAPIVLDAAGTGPTVTGTDFGFTWGTKRRP